MTPVSSGSFVYSRFFHPYSNVLKNIGVGMNVVYTTQLSNYPTNPLNLPTIPHET